MSKIDDRIDDTQKKIIRKMKFDITGKGSPVILIHGLFGNRDNLKILAKELETHFQVIRIDLPNHGVSEHIELMTYPLLAEKIHDLIDQLKLSSPAIVGHSMGGKVAMATALTYSQKISRIVIADIAPVPYTERHLEVFNALNSLDLSRLTNRQDALTQLINLNIDQATAQFLLKNLHRIVCVQNNQSHFEWKINLQGLQSNYANLIAWPYPDKKNANKKSVCYQSPALFLRGEQSDYIKLEYRNAVINQFPNAQAKTLAGTGHWLHSQKPLLFNRIVRDFLLTTQKVIR